MEYEKEEEKKYATPLTQVEKQDSLQSSLLENEGLINRSEAVTQEYKILPFKSQENQKWFLDFGLLKVNTVHTVG